MCTDEAVEEAVLVTVAVFGGDEGGIGTEDNSSSLFSIEDMLFFEPGDDCLPISFKKIISLP